MRPPTATRHRHDQSRPGSSLASSLIHAQFCAARAAVVPICDRRRASQQSSIFAAVDRMTAHTSMPQWQTFETRMRRRLVERCLRGAAAAIDANAPDAAKAFLAEARVICPGHPEIEALEEQLVSSLGVSLQPPKRLRWSRAAIIVVAGLALVCGAEWSSTPEGARALSELATTAATYVLEIVARVGLPQSV
jgi:hypothetical protein